MNSTIEKLKNLNENSATISGDWINGIKFAEAPKIDEVTPEITVVSFPDLNLERAAKVQHDSHVQPVEFFGQIAGSGETALENSMIPTPMNQSIMEANGHTRSKNPVESNSGPIESAETLTSYPASQFFTVSSQIEAADNTATVRSLANLELSELAIEMIEPAVDPVAKTVESPPAHSELEENVELNEPMIESIEQEVETTIDQETEHTTKKIEEPTEQVVTELDLTDRVETVDASDVQNEPQNIDSQQSEWHEFDESNELKISKLTDRIVKQFPPVAPTVMMFVSPEPTEFIEMTVARLACCLASRAMGKVLLIDANGENPRLSSGRIESDVCGLSDAINRDVHWKDCILPTSTENLSFLPAGAEKLSHRNCNPLTMRGITNQLKSEYKYVLVNAGSETNATTGAMCGSCDGTYLVVSLNDTDKSKAQLTVQALEKNLARLLGTIVVEPIS